MEKQSIQCIPVAQKNTETYYVHSNMVHHATHSIGGVWSYMLPSPGAYAGFYNGVSISINNRISLDHLLTICLLIALMISGVALVRVG